MVANGDSATLSDFEVETLVKSLSNVKLEDIGTDKWLTMHESLERIHMQAVYEAQTMREEHTKDVMISMDRLTFLICDLIVSEVWRKRVFDEIISHPKLPCTSMLLYMVLHHEIVALSLLQLLVFQPAAGGDSGCEESGCSGGVRLTEAVTAPPPLATAGDLVLDLLDYCQRTLTTVLASDDRQLLTRERPTAADTSVGDELCWQRDTLLLDASCHCVALLHYIGEQLPQLSVSVSSRLLRVHDTPLLLLALLEQPPWLRWLPAAAATGASTADGGRQRRQKRVDGKWLACPDEHAEFCRPTGQCWLLLLRLLAAGGTQLAALYELSEWRRTRLLRLQSLISEQLLAQLPVLQLLRQWLCQLQLGQVGAATAAARPPLIIETVPELWSTLSKQPPAGYSSWRQLASQQLQHQFADRPEQLRRQAERLSRLYDLDRMGQLVCDEQRCPMCGQLAEKRCARCRSVWYCGRQCQAKHWPDHKLACSEAATTD